MFIRSRRDLFAVLALFVPLAVFLFFTARGELDVIETPFLIGLVNLGFAGASALFFGIPGLIGAAIALTVACLFARGLNAAQDTAFTLAACASWVAVVVTLLRASVIGWRKNVSMRLGRELARLQERVRSLENMAAAGGVAEILGASAELWLDKMEAVVSNGRRILATVSPTTRDADFVQAFEEALADAERGIAAQRTLSGRMSFDVQKEGSIEGAVHKAMLEVRSLFDALGVEIEAQLAECGVPFTVDEDRFAVAIAHVLRNAAEASARGSKVTIAASTDYRGMRGMIEVVDRGAGMNADVMKHIFRPYFTTKPGRLGLGLSVAREVLTRMGGSLAVSANETRGMTFRARFPMKRPRLLSERNEEAVPDDSPTAPANES